MSNPVNYRIHRQSWPVQTGLASTELIHKVEKPTPLGRFGRPDDVANFLSFLCSNDGGWINRQILHSNGGLQSEERPQLSNETHLNDSNVNRARAEIKGNIPWSCHGLMDT